MYIIGLTGDIDSGKTTFSNNLGSNFKTHTHLESSDLIMEVANDLRLANSGKTFPSLGDNDAVNSWLSPLVAILFNRTHTKAELAEIEITPEKIQTDPDLYLKLADYLSLMQSRPELQNGHINLDNKEDHRALLQWLGGFITKKINGKAWYRELMRRSHEEPQSDIVTVGGLRFASDGECILDEDGVVVRIIRPSMATADAGDITERERTQVKFSSTIINDGTLGQLEACAELFSQDLIKHSIKPSYICSSL